MVHGNWLIVDESMLGNDFGWSSFYLVFFYYKEVVILNHFKDTFLHRSGFSLNGTDICSLCFEYFCCQCEMVDFVSLLPSTYGLLIRTMDSVDTEQLFQFRYYPSK